MNCPYCLDTHEHYHTVLKDDGFFDFASDLPKPAVQPSVKSKYEKCVQCSVEMSPYLDAYYGKNKNLGRHCSKCRAELIKDFEDGPLFP